MKPSTLKEAFRYSKEVFLFVVKLQIFAYVICALSNGSAKVIIFDFCHANENILIVFQSTYLIAKWWVHVMMHVSNSVL